MARTTRIPHTILATLAASCAVAPAIASSATNGGQSGGAPYGQPADVVGGPALYSRPSGMLGATLHFRGATAPGARVAIERRDTRLGTWLSTATAVADSSGAYVARWRTDHIGVFTIRARPSSTAVARVAEVPPVMPSITVTVFRPAIATWYGPGFYGRKTACGQRLTTTLVGVAHRGLPCGRSVQILYKGRTIVVPVVDRGPFHNGATWDLTAAAARQIGLTRTDRIGAVSLPPATLATR